MNIIDAYEALRNGKKVRKNHWPDKDSYIELNAESQIVDKYGDPAPFYAYNMVEPDSWEFYEPECEIEYFDFFEAMKRLKEGKKVTNVNDPQVYFKLIVNDLYFYVDDVAVDAQFTKSDIAYKKWYEVK